MKLFILSSLCLLCRLLFAQPVPTVVQGHNFRLNSLAISDDGQRILSSAGDKKLILWDTNLGKELMVVEESEAPFSSVTFSPSGNYFGAMTKGQFQVWKTGETKPFYILKPKERYTGVGINATIIDEEKVCVVMDDQIKIVNFITKEVLVETEKEKNFAVKIWYDNNRKLLSTYSYVDSMLHIYNTENLEINHSIKSVKGEVITMDIHPTEDKILIAGNSHKAKEIDFEGNLIREIEHEDAITLAICFYHNDKVIGISYNKVFIWSDEKCMVREFNFESQVTCNRSKNGKIAIGNWDFSVGILDFSDNSNYRSFEVEMVHCEGLQSTEAGFRFKGRDGIIRNLNFENILDPEVFDFNRDDDYENVQTTGNLQTMYVNEEYIYSSNQNESFIKSSQTKEVLASFETKNQIVAVCGNEHLVFDVTYNYKGSEINKINLQTKERAPFIFFEEKAVTQLAFDKNGNLLAAAGGSAWNDGFIYIINEKGELNDSIPCGKRAISDMKYYSSSHTLYYATGGFAQKIKAIDLKTKKELLEADGRVLALHPKGTYLALYKSKSSQKFSEIEIQSLAGEKISSFEAHSGIISHMEFSENGKYLISASWDKSVKIWDWKNSKLLLTIYFNSESENYHLLTPESYYFTSKENIDDIFFVKDGAIGLFEQYDLHLNRPDKVLETFEESDQDLIKFFKSAHSKRLERVDKIERTPKELGSLTAAPIIQYQYERTENVTFQGDFDNLLIKQNGVILTAEQFKLSSKNQECTVQLLTGENQFEIYEMDLDGLKGSSYFTTIQNSNKIISNLYLITLAASEFKDQNFNLTYASKDAKDIETYFKSEWTNGEVSTFSLLDNDFTTSGLKKLSGFLENSTVNDVVMVFVSSHGVLDANYDYFLASHDMDFQNPSTKGIPLQDLEDIVSGSKSKQKVVFIDACHSGEIDKSEIQIAESATTESDNVSFRGFQKFSNTSTLSAFQVSKELFTDLASESGISFISSAAGVEFALEGDEWRNGVFTYVLLEGLQSKSADLNEDGLITLSELEEHLINKVPVLTGGKQQPNARIKNPYLDFVIQEKK